MTTTEQTLEALSIRSLFQLHGSISSELHKRGVARTQNLTGDFAEFLFHKAFGWELKGNSHSGFDALNGTERIQIKCRKALLGNKAPQLGEFSKFELCRFDTLAAVIFEQDYSIRIALLIPWGTVDQLATTVQGRRRLHLREAVRAEPSVVDVTMELHKALEAHCS